MHMPAFRRTATAALLALVAVVITACVIMPGTFTSNLDVRRDGRFTFRYTGDIHVAAFNDAALARVRATTKFTPKPCYETASSAKPRPCTREEIAAQETAWSTSRAAADARLKRSAQSASKMLSGIDTSDPAAADQFAAQLARQVGWRKVVNKGDGRFEVDYAITGQLDRDFTFPTIEGMPIVYALLQVSRRQDGTVRIDAAGFAPAARGMPYQTMLQAMAGPGGDGQSAAGMPTIDGTFTIATDAEILANNTDEGPKTTPDGKALNWRVTANSASAPMALLRLDR